MSDNANKQKSDQIELGALWKKQGQTQKFLSGALDLSSIGINKTVPIVIFTNKFKQKDAHPDYRIFVSRPKPQDSAPASSPAASTTASRPARAPQAPAPTPEPEPEADQGSNDDIL